jgi:hypothetical protein
MVAAGPYARVRATDTSRGAVRTVWTLASHKWEAFAAASRLFRGALEQLLDIDG